ncbi:hypothetical protein [Anaerocolumna cellulosilytica]|nr:hypothetical protein [Anaerocolumna cellulosilytica]MBB5194617.1 archaellum component FlaG (FlaF/FlaG flagellin family) [Anaerocolumna cellulosilytica]
MKELILPITMIIVCLIAAIVMVLLLQRTKDKVTNTQEKDNQERKKTAQDFVNVKDIEDIFLYTMDGYIMSYVKVQSISKDLLSKAEKKNLTMRLAEEFQTVPDFKFIAVSRPVDITPLVTEYTDLLRTSTDPIQKEILRNELSVITEFSLSGEVVQREFYYILWEKYVEDAEYELRKRVNELASKVVACGIQSEILKKPDIIRLCNLIDNPAFAVIEDTQMEAVIPYIQ